MNENQSKNTSSQHCPPNLDVTSITLRAGIPYPVIVLRSLIQRYRFRSNVVLDQCWELYDLAWATNLALNHMIPCTQRRLGKDDYFDYDYLSLLPGSAEPSTVSITALLRHPGIVTSRVLLLGVRGEEFEPERAHVLVVEDDLQVARFYRFILERTGFEVSVVHTVAAARLCVNYRPPNLILMEVDLPDTCGLNLCRELKSRANTAAIPIVFCSGIHDARALALSLGAADFLEKPIEVTELTERIRAVLERTRPSGK